MFSQAESGCQSQLHEFVFTVETELQKSEEKSSTAYMCLELRTMQTPQERALSLIPAALYVAGQGGWGGGGVGWGGEGCHLVRASVCQQVFKII